MEPIKAIDVKLSGEVKGKGVAWYNPEADGEFYTFIKDVLEHEKVIGFEWDGSKFGVIIGE